MTPDAKHLEPDTWSMIDLSIIIVNWNTRELLKQCLESVYATVQGLEFEVWVVDNASSDGSAAMLRESFPQVMLVENSNNEGFSRANNRALMACSGEYICLLNPDTIVFSGTFQVLVQFLVDHNQAGFCGPRVLNQDMTIQQSWGSFPTLVMEILPYPIRLLLSKHKLTRQRYAGETEPYQESVMVDWIKGACLVLRRSVTFQIGLLDEDYFMYAEEMDWCLRGKKSGYSTWYIPDVKIIHYGGAAGAHVPSRVYLDFHKSRLLFFRKHYSWVTNLIVRVYLMAKCMAYGILVHYSPLMSSGSTMKPGEARNLYFRTFMLAWGK